MIPEHAMEKVFLILMILFFNAIHNWPFSIKEFKFLSKDEKAEEVKLQGEKMMIVVKKY